MTRPKIKVGSKQVHLPQSKALRIGLGILFLAGGLLWFLPILGAWMIPIGLIILSHDFPLVRRWRRRTEVWWQRSRIRAMIMPAVHRVVAGIARLVRRKQA